MRNITKEGLIMKYFEEGFTTRNISFILKDLYNITLSTRQLKRILKRLGLSKRCYSRPADIINFIKSQLSESGLLHGYRMMYYKCLQEGLRVRMEDVRTILRILDPTLVGLRRARRLQRRAYFANGPNFIWHIDGYDKLKPYGLCIHGSICGFSRKIIWLNVHTTNNDPRIIGGYFIEAVRECGGVPRLVRGDFGTENVVIRELQQFLRRDHINDRANTYIAGASVTNQRIESWWGFLRRECVQFWMDVFKDLLDNGEFDGDFLDKNLVQFCFTAVIQEELDNTANLWNSHTIRPSRNPRVPYGRPLQMYNIPSLWGAEDQLYITSQDDIHACIPECSFRSSVPCDVDVYEICIRIMRQNNMHELPLAASDAIDMYRFLKHEIDSLL